MEIENALKTLIEFTLLKEQVETLEIKGHESIRKQDYEGAIKLRDERREKLAELGEKYKELWNYVNPEATKTF